MADTDDLRGGGGGSQDSGSDQKHPFDGNQDGSRDLLLPVANVGRIMKRILPSNVKVSKEAKETMQECVSEFIGFVTVEASDRCRKLKKKTINGDDICSALSDLGLDDYVEPMQRYLSKYREYEAERAATAGAGVFLPVDQTVPRFPAFDVGGDCSQIPKPNREGS